MTAPILASTLGSADLEPQAFDLTVLDNLMAYLYPGGAPSNIDEQLLQRMISSASQAIQSWLGYDVQGGTKLAATAYTETLDSIWDGNVTPWIYAIPVRWSPIQSVASVTMDGVSIPSGGDAVKTPGYFFDPTDPILIYVAGYRPCPRGKKTVVVSYTGGYAAIPFDVEQACIEMIALGYSAKDRVGVKSKSMAGESVSYITGQMSDSTRQAMLAYRRVVIG